MPATRIAHPARLVDIARECGLSRATVSKVLLGTGGPNTRVSPETAKRVLAAARKYHFRPNLAARTLKGVRTRLLGLITGFGSSSVLLDRLKSFETESWQRGYRLLPGHAHADPARAIAYIDDLVARGAEGLILVDFQNDMLPAIADRLEHLPPRVFQSREPVPNQACVVLDRAEGVRRAVHHLVECGRKRIAVMIGKGIAPATALRREGYNRGMAECGLTPDPVLDFDDTLDQDAGKEDFDRAIHTLVIENNADAIIASDDFIGVHTIKALRRRSVNVPAEVAVVGFNNLDIAIACEPELTSVDQCNPLVVKQTLSLLIDLIENGDTRARRKLITIAPELVVRGSTVPGA